MNSKFVYRGRDSLDFGLLIAAPPHILAPERDQEIVNVPGRDAPLRIDKGRYLPVTKSYAIEFKCKRGEVEKISREVKAWLLAGRGDYMLQDTYDWDYFRIASFSGEIDIENILLQGGRTVLSFLCHQYKYELRGLQKTNIFANKKLINPELFESRPYIRINGSGRCELNISNSVKNETIVVQNVSEYVEIDSEAVQVFKGNISMNANTIMGDFPTLGPGENLFDWNSNVSSIEIIPRWRTL